MQVGRWSIVQGKRYMRAAANWTVLRVHEAGEHIIRKQREFQCTPREHRVRASVWVCWAFSCGVKRIGFEEGGGGPPAEAAPSQGMLLRNVV